MINVLIVEDEPLIAEAHQTYPRPARGLLGGRHRPHRPRCHARRLGSGHHRDADRSGTVGHRTARRERDRPGIGTVRPSADSRHHRDHLRARPADGPRGGRPRSVGVPVETLHVRSVPRSAGSLPPLPRSPARRHRCRQPGGGRPRAGRTAGERQGRSSQGCGAGHQRRNRTRSARFR